MARFDTWYWMYKRGDKKSKTTFWIQVAVLLCIATLIAFTYGKAMKAIMAILKPDS